MMGAQIITDGDAQVYPIHHVCVGITKREYFAAMALQGLAVDATIQTIQYEADKAVQMADALILALNTPK